MEVSFDEKTGVPKFVLNKLDEKDIDDAKDIERMMQTPGWAVLKNYFEVAREAIIDKGKDCTRLKSKREMAAERWAVLKGWDEAAKLADKIVARAVSFEEAQNNTELSKVTREVNDAINRRI